MAGEERKPDKPEKPAPAAAAAEGESSPSVAVAKMLQIAKQMAEASAAASARMTAQVESAVSAVKTLNTKVDAAVASLRADLGTLEAKTNANTQDLQAVQLAPTRARAITLPEITGGADANNPAAARTPSPEAPVFVSISPLEAEVSKASVRAVTNAVPAARHENRLLSLAIAALIVAAEVLRFLSH